ncbi:MAG TPA: rhodanese-like domain-containing protein [Thermoanaerobaculia bacterium]|nr:rhodanese-like domain-containing protein [Thermoanaerobaculia bacterium]
MPPIEITASELHDEMSAAQPPLLIDVRNPWEHEVARIAGSTLIPLDSLQSRISEIEAGRRLVVYCHHGMRSLTAAQFLQQAGREARSLQGGIDHWSRSIDPDVPRY